MDGYTVPIRYDMRQIKGYIHKISTHTQLIYNDSNQKLFSLHQTPDNTPQVTSNPAQKRLHQPFHHPHSPK